MKVIQELIISGMMVLEYTGITTKIVEKLNTAIQITKLKDYIE